MSVSKRYTIIDSFIVDYAVTGNYNQYALDTDLTATVTDDGTLLETNSTGVGRRLMNNNNIGRDSNDITSAFCLEFDIVEINSRVGLNYYQTTGDAISNYDSLRLDITGECHYKMVHDGTHFSIWIDDELKVNNIPHTWNSGRFAFMVFNAGVSMIKYKNFVVYPIE